MDTTEVTTSGRLVPAAGREADDPLGEPERAGNVDCAGHRQLRTGGEERRTAEHEAGQDGNAATEGPVTTK
ncbi:MAG: hypothetical protein R2712_14620 [Vicinamibacterales bacterium]